jgi:RNA polymerase sigma-70 factor (ECF subfamily)
MSEPEQITRLLKAWKDGDPSALERVTPLIYDELHRVAQAYLRSERSDHTLVPTALVNEAYLRLIGQDQPDWQSRKHFLGVAAHVMRQILVDHARRQRAGKRGSGAKPVELDSAGPLATAFKSDLLDLDDALTSLEKQDERKSKAIELRFFGGLTLEEVGETMGLSAATVHRELKMAQAWLARELEHPRKINP